MSRAGTDEVFAGELDAWLKTLDADFDAISAPISDRPLHALLKLLEIGALEVHAGMVVDTTDPWKHADELWFRVLYKRIEDWYRTRYGDAVDGGKSPRLAGAVLIGTTAFRLDIPAARVTIETEGKTIWLHWFTGIGPGEDPAKWISARPNLDAFEPEIADGARRALIDAASLLRAVHTRMLGLPGTPEAVVSIVRGIRSHLASAAERLVAGDGDSVQRAWWDLQMCIEHALKGLMHFNGKEARHTHDVTRLMDDCRALGVNLDGTLLEGWPSPKEVSALRYGQGTRDDAPTFFAAYLRVLRLLDSALASMKPMDLNGSGILVRRPPWLDDSD